MSYKLLIEILNYEEAKKYYSKIERENIECELKKKIKSSAVNMNLGKKIVDIIDSINDH